MLGAAAAEDDGDAGGGGAESGVVDRRRSSRTTLPTAAPDRDTRSHAPHTRAGAVAPATVAVSAGPTPAVAGRSEQPTAGDGLDLPRGRRGRLRPLRQPDLGDARERGRRAGGRGRDVVRVRDGRGHRCPRPGAARRGRRGRAGRLLRQPGDAAPDGAAGPAHGAPGRPLRRRQRRGRGGGRRPGLGRDPHQPDAHGWSTSRRWPPARRRPAPCWSSTAPSPPRSCSARWRPARTSWCTARRSTSPATPTCCSASPWRARSTIVDRLVEVRSTQGAVPGTVEAWLALRGLRTLHLRVERASANAADLATRLASPPDGLHGPLPGPGRDGEHRAGPQPRGRRGDRAGPPGSGCTRRASAASSPASSGAAGGPGRAPTYRRP